MRMNPTSSFPAGIYAPPLGLLRKPKPKSLKAHSSTKLFRSQSTNEGRLYKKIIDWRRSDARQSHRKSQQPNGNVNDLAKQMRSLNIKTTESARDCRVQEKPIKKRTRFVVTDLSSNNLARHDEKFFRPLTGREKQRRISVWVQNVEKQRVDTSGTSYSACDSPSTENTGALSASLVSQQGSSGRTGAAPQRTSSPAFRQMAHRSLSAARAH